MLNHLVIDRREEGGYSLTAGDWAGRLWAAVWDGGRPTVQQVLEAWEEKDKWRRYEEGKPAWEGLDPIDGTQVPNRADKFNAVNYVAVDKYEEPGVAHDGYGFLLTIGDWTGRLWVATWVGLRPTLEEVMQAWDDEPNSWVPYAKRGHKPTWDALEPLGP